MTGDRLADVSSRLVGRELGVLLEVEALVVDQAQQTEVVDPVEDDLVLGRVVVGDQPGALLAPALAGVDLERVVDLPGLDDRDLGMDGRQGEEELAGAVVELAAPDVGGVLEDRDGRCRSPVRRVDRLDQWASLRRE
jgi:hypothetical protein